LRTVLVASAPSLVSWINMDRFAGATTRPSAMPERLKDLTPREREVLELVADALSSADIAGRLTMAETTVKTHVAHPHEARLARPRPSCRASPRPEAVEVTPYHSHKVPDSPETRLAI
jgi:DNA-binding CsgD family transcriptional regulator